MNFVNAPSRIFATPSFILETSGSVGLSLIMWLIGALIATSGLLVYVEWGTGLPRSGGELTYLSYTYPMVVVACYAAYAALMPWPAGNSVVFGECEFFSSRLSAIQSLTQPVFRSM